MDFAWNAGLAMFYLVNSSFLSYKVFLGSNPNPGTQPPHKPLAKCIFLTSHSAKANVMV